MFDILIIGAGVVGANIARELSKYKLNIGIIEKEPDVCMGSSKANSAIVHGGYAEEHTKLKGRICFKGRKKFEQLNKELNFGYLKTGSLVLSESEDDLDNLKNLEENGIKNGLNDIKIIDSNEIKKMETNINENFKYALFCEGAGICSPFEFTIALIENAIDNGVKLFLNEEVKKIENNNDYFEVITTNKSFRSKIIINCAGLGAEKIANMVNDFSFNLKFRSGQYFVFDKSEGGKINSVLFQMPTKLGKGILVSKTVYGNLIIGPDALDENTANLNTDSQRLVEIYKKSLLVTDKININKIIRTFSGVRAVSNNDDFIIEESAIKNFINVAGIQSPGLTSSPAIAEYIVDILKNKGFTLEENQSFNPYRKGYGNYNHNKSNKDNLICICEEKTEEEIMECFNRPIPINTIDAIKRRVRAGMGMCQGRRCKPKIKEILENKNINLDYRTDIEIKDVDRVDRFKLIKDLKENI
ncbi:FAD-dependent oxidoreductase [Miniphocaeibacter halophilus]|uniref:FAD-dependent oxidoreductase n=1 Tax=Miniphocaeibacter halophilus TaxID=2931922 RepID=A0AC61N167_9FIRM|nr:FAD-dependent oxidoreductase [Miniphocaeibacter halophilus]QQK07688.1 FAD-dependent oxidoreductase [Miniphocaeibacter halophilus]